LNGFVGEFLILLGSWMSTAVRYAWIATMLAGTGMIWAAVYMLWMLQRVVFGKLNHAENAALRDLNGREMGLIAPLLILMLFMGVFPRPFLERSRAAVELVRQRVTMPQTGGTYELTKSVEANPVEQESK
jgi:NADH-quinone oxidoreductase subunit M